MAREVQGELSSADVTTGSELGPIFRDAVLFSLPVACVTTALIRAPGEVVLSKVSRSI